MSSQEFTWLNKQGVRSSSGFELQREDRFTMTYREGDNMITIDVDNGNIGGKHAVLMSPNSLSKWDNGKALNEETQKRVQENIREALAFQRVSLGVEG
jgi:hypothetical protein